MLEVVWWPRAQACRHKGSAQQWKVAVGSYYIMGGAKLFESVPQNLGVKFKWRCCKSSGNLLSLKKICRSFVCACVLGVGVVSQWPHNACEVNRDKKSPSKCALYWPACRNGQAVPSKRVCDLMLIAGEAWLGWRNWLPSCKAALRIIVTTLAELCVDTRAVNVATDLRKTLKTEGRQPSVDF